MGRHVVTRAPEDRLDQSLGDAAFHFEKIHPASCNSAEVPAGSWLLVIVLFSRPGTRARKPRREEPMSSPTNTGVTRRQVLVAGSTFAGYALSVETVLAQAIKTDTDGLVAGDQQVTIDGVNVPVYEARPATGKDHPIILVISEIWGVHEYIKDSTRRFAKAGYYAIAPELFVREGGVAQLPNVQDVLKIVLAQKRERRWATSRRPSTGPRSGPT
jgi:hypothetical protein